jgi:radical SAM protein
LAIVGIGSGGGPNFSGAHSDIPLACNLLLALSMDFNQRPFTVVWETTRACDLACVHCRAEANPQRSPAELSFAEAQRLVHDVKAFGQPYPIFILTGGDPAKRADILDIISFARSEGLRVAMTPSATPLLTRDRVRHFTEAGLMRLAVSLDGKDSASHDGFRGVAGSFDQTLRILDWCREFGLESQIHTTVTRHVLADLPAIAEMIAAHGSKLWALFSLIALGRAARGDIRRLSLNARQFEALFEWLYELAKSVPFDITPREGYHFRRVLLQRRAADLGIPVEVLLAHVEAKHSTPTDVFATPGTARIARAPLGVNVGKGVVFVSHQGDVQPSGFLNLVGGNLRSQTLPGIYRNSPVFQRVRDFTQLTGKCGVCEFKNICGGSRSRAFAVTGDPMQSDPYCVYQPKAIQRSNDHGKSSGAQANPVRALNA